MGAIDTSTDRGSVGRRPIDRREAWRPEPVPAHGGAASGVPWGDEGTGAGQGYDAGDHDVVADRITRPLSVLVTELGTGVLLVQDYHSGVTVHVNAIDGRELRAALDAAFNTVGVPVRVPPIVRPRIWHR